MANVFAVFGAVGDVAEMVKEGANLGSTTLKVMSTITKEGGEIIVKEIKTQNKTWRKVKKEELLKMKYTEGEADAILTEVENEVKLLELNN